LKKVPIVGVDPNRKNALVAVRRGYDTRNNQKWSTLRLSTREYLAELGTAFARSLHEKWMRQCSLFEAMRTLPTSKTGDLLEYRHYVHDVYQILGQVIDMEMMPKVRRLRVTQWIKRQHTINKFVKRLIKFGRGEHPRSKMVLVAFGAAKFSYHNAPIQTIRQTLRRHENVILMEVREDFTSQRCSHGPCYARHHTNCKVGPAYKHSVYHNKST